MLELRDLFRTRRGNEAERFERFRRVVTMRRSGATLQVCADAFGISRERVRQMCAQWWRAERRKRSKPRNYAGNALKQFYPDDIGFDYVASLQDKKL